MKTLLASVAAAALIAGPTLAQSDASTDEMQHSETMSGAVGSGDMSGMVRARDITGKNIYSTNAGSTDAMSTEMVTDDMWRDGYEVEDITSAYTDIGEIEDLVLNRDGELTGVVAEVGGFLDIGDKHVMLPVKDLKIVRSNGEVYYVTRLSEEQLEELEGVDESWFE
jgi:hypothetical protein